MISDDRRKFNHIPCHKRERYMSDTAGESETVREIQRDMQKTREIQREYPVIN